MEFILVLVLFGLLALGSYFLWMNFPQETTSFEEYAQTQELDLPFNSSQFYANMRYSDRRISYSLSNTCSMKKRNDFTDAVLWLESRTVLDFYEDQDGEIIVSCANLDAEPDEDGHFIAGEGGPSVIVNASQFAVITRGKIALYRSETCDMPQIATHELLHALGFDHSRNPESLMYPVTDCDQELDDSIIEQINELYRYPSAADLVLEKVSGNASGRYFSFEAVMANYGLKDVGVSSLTVIADGKPVRTFDTENLGIGARKTLTITNLRIPGGADAVEFVFETSEQEITKANNKATITLTS